MYSFCLLIVWDLWVPFSRKKKVDPLEVAKICQELLGPAFVPLKNILLIEDKNSEFMMEKEFINYISMNISSILYV